MVLSTTTVSIPSRDARTAAASPASPAPITTSSVLVFTDMTALVVSGRLSRLGVLTVQAIRPSGRQFDLSRDREALLVVSHVASGLVASRVSCHDDLDPVGAHIDPDGPVWV